jgi:hypothetical protein
MADAAGRDAPLTGDALLWLALRERLVEIVKRIDGPYNGQIFAAKGYSLADLQAELREIAATAGMRRDGG